jgi:uncharacterized RDD family membrane protein YckC
VIGRREIGSWLAGPGVASGTSPDYPGQRLGRPATGPGSVGRPGRRLLGILVDWVAALAVSRELLPGLNSLGPLLVLLVEQVLLVGTSGFGLGHRLVGLRVETIPGERPGPLRALIRSVLLVLGVPALVWDADQRGLHDKAAGTLVVRSGGPAT